MNKCLFFNVVQFGELSRSNGVYRIAHYLREHNLDVEVIDYANFWTLDELQQLFRSRYTRDLRIVGFSHLFSLWTPILEEFTGWIKQTYPEVTIISGSGVNPMFDSKYIDYYIRGFGEYAIIALYKYIIGNGPRPVFLLGNTNGKKIIDAIANYPAFPMKNLMIRYEDRDFIQPTEWLTVEFARGCKFSCDFCNFPVLGVKGDYSRDADDFELQLRDAYERFGVTNYLVSDETFNDRTEKITKFADAVEKLPFQPWFSGFVRADLLVKRPADREEMLRMNFLGHYYGIESFQNQAAKIIGKGMDSDKLKQGLLDVKDYYNTHGSGRYRGGLSLIVGLPYETVESVQETKQWLIDNWQTQSYTVFNLDIGIGELDRKSKISMDYKSYGYREMDPNEVEFQKSQYTRKRTRSSVISPNILYWENDNMNYFDAVRLGDEVAELKHQYDFRPSCFTLAHRLAKPLPMDELLQLRSFDDLVTKDVSPYIQKKLSL